MLESSRDAAQSFDGGMNRMNTNPEQIKIPVCLTLPKQYVNFWEELRRIYGLPESALEQLASNAVIADFNNIHDQLPLKEDLQAQAEIKQHLSLGESL
jgi:hypothetical protein